MNDDHLQGKPIFFDPTERRYGVLSAMAAVLSFVAIMGALMFLVTIALTPNLRSRAMQAAESHPVLHPLREYTAPDVKAIEPARAGERSADLAPSIRQVDRFVLRHDRNVQDAKSRLREAIRREESTQPIPMGAILPGSVHGPVRAVFFQNDEDKDGIDSLEHHIQNTTHLLPIWLQLTDSGKNVQVTQELSANETGPVGPTYDDTAIDLARKNGVAILPVLQNAGDGSFPASWIHNLVSNPAARARVIRQSLGFVLAGHYQGINIDLETDQSADRKGMTAFVQEAAKAFHQHGLLVTQDVELDSDAYSLPQLARADDFLVPMLYDQHCDGSAPGPIAGQSWFAQELSAFLAQVPADRAVIGFGNYAYDWKAGSTSAVSMSFEEACQTAEESKDGEDGVIGIDPGSLNPTFTYYDDSNGQGDNEIPHRVWLQDATTAYNELRLASKYHPLGAALWRVGMEDPSLWSFFNRDGDAALAGFDPRSLSNVTYNYFGTSFIGQGDVLDVLQAPTPGYRTISFDSARGVVTGESFQTYPSQWVIRRTGLVDQVTGENTPKKIALTFDDGPDPRWTPQILDILQRYHVPATFFVVGENAEAYPGLLEREWNMGMEVGNHSFTHPEMDNVSPLRTRLELDACQRVIEAMTGHMTTLFRAPNRADSEPTTQQDFEPILDAHNLDYLFIGEQIDPTDWYPGIKADQIVNYVLSNPDKGNCVLLHDAGGETRAETIKALPRIIEGLKARGYSFVPVSALIYPRLSAAAARNAAFPPVTGTQRLTVAYDRAFFYTTFALGKVMSTLFLIAICLGVARILFMGILAVNQSVAEKRRTFDPNFQPSVSVVIAAYNEAKVINRTIDTLLRCDYPDLEIVVVDDGSQDGTADVVRAEYGDHASVRVLRKPNGGKASALNLGIKECRGEVIVALDADTVFARDTISKLVRHFSDPAVGAVSGNVKVGNRNNVWTIWQAVEYITSQNFDRRSFDLLNCITVVPGAVGAWRRDAIVLAGMYSSQTLAEDTDLTFKVRKLGYRIHTDNEALAYTEAPENGRNLAKQRFRWAFGTLQCLWKHRDALLRTRYGTFGTIAMPSLWIFQIGFQAIAPIVDLGILWTWFDGKFIAPQNDHTGVVMLLGYWALFTTVEMIGALVAFRLDREDVRLIPWLPLQRFAYRQLMYYVILKSIRYALVGKRVGWGKFERKGTVTEPAVTTAAESVKEVDEGEDRLVTGGR